MSPLVERLLAERGVTDAETFLNPDYASRYDPFLLPDMGLAVDRILNAIEKKEKIAVWHDYDCDGIPGGALLSDFFMKIEYPVHLMVAERSEGYGLNMPGIQVLADEGVSVLITVDCGITHNAEVAFAQSLGIDVIVTDHHLPQAELPPAYAVVNPHRADSVYPEKVLCGTGVAFKLVEALILRNSDLRNHYFEWTEGWEKWLLDLVALATVADMVPLTGENRTLVKYGLQVMAKGRRKGLAALLRRERIPMHSVTEDDIGFSIAPKINASSRMESPKLGVELLTTTSDARADELANKLVALNKARKLEGARVAKEVKHRLESIMTAGNIIVMGSQEWRPSLLGIAGNNIVETYGKTVCLWGKDPSTGSGQAGLIKGSIRSNGQVNVVELMTHARHIFQDFGGHESSGGFSITAEAIHKLPIALEEALARIGLSETVPEQENHAGTLTLAEVNDRTFNALREMAPFGMDNPKPIFRFDAVTVDRILRFGGGKEHVRLALSDDSGADAEAIAFFVGRSPFKDDIDLLSTGDRVTLDACLDRSFFGGRPSLRLRIENLKT